MKRYLLSVATLGLIALILTACDYLPASFRIPLTPTVSASALPLAALKYRLIQECGGIGADIGIHFCDPDYYPLGRPGYEQQQAAKMFATIAQDSQQFPVILGHLGLSRLTTFTAAQQLSI